VGSFVCNCTDCRKITASMFASNFTVRDGYVDVSFCYTEEKRRGGDDLWKDANKGTDT
jgi:hypothetical protein